MATITYKSFLMYSTDGTSWEKLIDIKDIPDGIIAQKEEVEYTTLSHGRRVYIPGIEEGSSDGLPFTCNYDLDDFKKVKALEEQDLHFAVWFGGVEPTTVGGLPTPDGSLGKFGGTGKVSIFLNGAGVNDVREMTVSVSPTSNWNLIEDGD